MTKIDIISGFLGAGKTTLIKKLLAEVFAGEQVVLIENEFGEIGIDGGFLKESGVEIREMNSGCICCSLVGDFGKSLQEVMETYHPDRILIEPSGVGKLSDVMKAIDDVGDTVDIRINSFTTVVDVEKCKLYRKNFGEFFSNQISYAGAIILSRTDKASEEKINESVAIIKELNGKAPVITTPIHQLDGEKLFETMEHGKTLEEEMMAEVLNHHHECGCEHHHDHEHHDHEHSHCHEHEHHHDHEHHHADDIFQSWGKETTKEFTDTEIEFILKTLESEAAYGEILRAKGMVAGQNGIWIYFDMVPGEHEIREGEPDYTGRFCVIGVDLQEDKLEQLIGV